MHSVKEITLKKIHDYLWEIPQSGGMKVPGRIYASEKMLKNILENDNALQQVVNVAHLPGINKYSIAMPDIHWGYGFPIGGVAATSAETGVISPGGVGYDINCGVRLVRTNMEYNSVRQKIPQLISELFKAIPTGVGAKGAIKKLSVAELKQLSEKGVAWAIENGFGEAEDIDSTEEYGNLKQANYDALSSKIIERGLDQLGTLGSGNHFLEIDVVDKIYDESVASSFGLFKGQLTVLIHTGSRGFGYQVCDDYLKTFVQSLVKYGIHLPDKQLACAPVQSEEGRNYLAAMGAAANFAWNNRQVIMGIARNVFKKVFSATSSELGFGLVYDVCHNIAKFEEHVDNNSTLQKFCVHRKGATRALPPAHINLPKKYSKVGQPVLIPGDMGRYSFVCVGTERAMKETFGSSCHGAGRVMSRTKALKLSKGRDLISELKRDGIVVEAQGRNTIAEEMPEAYKDVQEVVDVMHFAGITPKVARLRPVGVIKG